MNSDSFHITINFNNIVTAIKIILFGHFSNFKYLTQFLDIRESFNYLNIIIST